ncbi:MAG: hypothetical protein O9340_12090 [Cyclobacteriaceae bacterium]|jgi:hypothetical protein|nr:hypothetical protein [Cyclobacteriaceae bacterium]
MKDLVRKRRPDAVRLSGKDEVINTSINECIDFTIVNAGSETIYYGFSSETKPDIPIEPGESAPWPLYRPCEVWDGKVYIKFEANGSIALVLKTV